MTNTEAIRKWAEHFGYTYHETLSDPDTHELINDVVTDTGGAWLLWQHSGDIHGMFVDVDGNDAVTLFYKEHLIRACNHG